MKIYFQTSNYFYWWQVCFERKENGFPVFPQTVRELCPNLKCWTSWTSTGIKLHVYQVTIIANIQNIKYVMFPQTSVSSVLIWPHNVVSFFNWKLHIWWLWSVGFMHVAFWFDLRILEMFHIFLFDISGADLNSISRSGLFKYPSVQLQISGWCMKYFLVDRIYKICEDKVDLHEEKINYIEFQSKCGKICSLKFNLQPNWRFQLSQQPARCHILGRFFHRFLSDIKESQIKNKKD